MEFEDSRNALYCDPNAYIQNHESKPSKKKIVFSEPYECLPNFYINNNFKKGNCDCIGKNNFHKNKFPNNNSNHDCNCIHNNFDCEKPKNHNINNSNFGFNINSFLPLLGSIVKGGDIGGMTKILSNLNQDLKGEGLMNVLKNPSFLSSILSLFKLGKSSNLAHKKEIKATDFEINNYTRVE